MKNDQRRIPKDILKELRGLREGQSNLEEDIKEIKHNQVYIWEDIKRLDRRLETQEYKMRRIAP